MKGIIDCGKYEFSPVENNVLLALSKGLHRLGFLVFAVGTLFTVYLLVAYFDPGDISSERQMILNAVDYGLWIIIAILVIYLSIMIVRLAWPLKQIVETTGADMAYLMSFLQELISMVRTCFLTLIVVCVLMMVSLLMLIFVF
ncbi:MAG: hypothetical protein CSYNP_00465 [Syntrophus sp. SKADARSKE-3]|nr:hypothetical protein [Syntrophus sp. SKADARSKE-3]